jgi:putative FmdB family regulatory protein
MPLYEYQCEACGHRFEVIQKFSDAPIEACTRCGAAVKKLLSSPAIQFKGSGWYITDYARAGKSDATPAGSSGAKGETAAAASEAKSDSTGTETKSESSAPAKASTSD